VLWMEWMGWWKKWSLSAFSASVQFKFGSDAWRVRNAYDAFAKFCASPHCVMRMARWWKGDHVVTHSVTLFRLGVLSVLVYIIKQSIPKQILHSQCATTNLSRNGDLNLNTRLQADAGDLFNDLARGVQINEAFVDFEFVTIPCFGSLTARSLTGSDLQNFRGETDRSLDTQLLVLGAIDQIAGELFQVPDIAAGQGNPDLVDFGSRDSTRCIVLFFSFGDVTHFNSL